MLPLATDTWALFPAVAAFANSVKAMSQIQFAHHEKRSVL